MFVPESFYLFSFLAKEVKEILIISEHFGKSTLLFDFGYQADVAHFASLFSLSLISANPLS